MFDNRGLTELAGRAPIFHCFRDILLQSYCLVFQLKPYFTRGEAAFFSLFNLQPT